MAIEAIDHVQLAVPPGGEDEATDFYEVVPEISRAQAGGPGDDGRLLVRERLVTLHLGVEADFRPSRKAHPELLVTDLPTLLSALDHAGVEVGADEPLEGYGRVYADDPFGHRIELTERAPNAE